MLRSHNRWLSHVLVAASIIGCALVVTITDRASAMHSLMHVTLVKSDPKLNDTLTASPKAIRLWFSEAVQTGATAIHVTSPAGEPILVGKVTVANTPKAPVEVAVMQTLTPGRYTVEWRTMASDGHPAKGTLGFVVR